MNKSDWLFPDRVSIVTQEGDYHDIYSLDIGFEWKMATTVTGSIIAKTFGSGERRVYIPDVALPDIDLLDEYIIISERGEVWCSGKITRNENFKKFVVGDEKRYADIRRIGLWV